MNSDPVGALLCSAEVAHEIRHVTGVVVVEINQGDIVYIRTHPTLTNDDGCTVVLTPVPHSLDGNCSKLSFLINWYPSIKKRFKCIR